MKTFITVYDVEKHAAAGKREVELSRDVVITPDAIDKARKLGLRLLVRDLHPHLPGWAHAGTHEAPSFGSEVEPRDSATSGRLRLLGDKKLLVTGVLTPQSIAFAVARVAQEEGAEVVLTGFGAGLSTTQQTAKALPRPPDVLEMDINDRAQVEGVARNLAGRWGRLDGLLHAVAVTPRDALGGNFLRTPWESAALVFRTNAYSLKALVAEMLPLLSHRGGAVVSLDFDASVAWPAYDWVGVSKAALESITRYLARDVGRHGVRVNSVASGLLRTVAAASIPGFDRFIDLWHRRAPLGWDAHDPTPVADAVIFLLSDRARSITGEILHVDGGYHAMGTDLSGPGSYHDGQEATA